MIPELSDLAYYQEKDIMLFHGDCLDVMSKLQGSGLVVDMVLSDPPYGTTRNKWDSPIALTPLWKSIDYFIKDNTPIVLTAQTPFDKVLGASNISKLKYEWIWEKTAASGHLNSKKMPMKAHENILVFYDKLPFYNPQKTKGHTPVHSYTKHTDDGPCYGKTKVGISGGGSTERYPRSVLIFPSDKQKNNLHPTQKPLALFMYLISTYTKPGDIVFDFCLGSGTTAEACKILNRKCIGIDKHRRWLDITIKRLIERKGIKNDSQKNC